MVMIGGALLCVALAGGWSLGAAAAGQPGAAAGRRQFELAQRVGRTKQLESEAMREAALARLEAKVSRGCVRAIAAAHGPLQAAPPGPASLQASEGGMPSAAPSALQCRRAVCTGRGAALENADVVYGGGATAGKGAAEGALVHQGQKERSARGPAESERRLRHAKRPARKGARWPCAWGSRNARCRPSGRSGAAPDAMRR